MVSVERKVEGLWCESSLSGHQSSASLYSSFREEFFKEQLGPIDAAKGEGKEKITR